MTVAIGSIYAHLPVVPAEGQYRMGSTLQGAVDDLYFNTTQPDGTRLLCAEPEGWEGLSFLTPIDQAGGRDGGLIGPSSVAPRILPVNGVMVAPNPAVLRQQIRSLRARLGPRKTVVWDQFDFGVGRRMGMVCRAQGDFVATPVRGHQRGGVAAPFSFTLVAANPPWKFATGAAQTQCMGLPASVTSGRTYNRTFNWNYGASTNPGGQITVRNDGDIDAWPVITMQGQVDGPIVTNETNGGGFIMTSNLASGQSVTIDSRTGVITPSQYRIVGRPFPLSPGDNTIRWRATSGLYAADAQLCVTWRSTWE